VAHGLLLSVLSAFCYGMSPILYKLGYASGLGEMDLLQYRFIVATLLIFLLLLVTSPASLRPTPSLLLKAAFTGLVLYCLQSYLFLKALRYIPAATTSLILYFYPVTVTLLSIFFFKSRLNRTTCIALLLCLAGCILVSLDAIHREHDITGLLLALGAMAVFSVYMITVQFVVRTDRPLTFTFYVFLFVALAFSSLHDPLALRAFDARQMLICSSWVSFPRPCRSSPLFRRAKDRQRHGLPLLLLRAGGHRGCCGAHPSGADHAAATVGHAPDHRGDRPAEPASDHAPPKGCRATSSSCFNARPRPH
jgi:drug/metabolite transporter (DMT)-like permease